MGWDWAVRQWQEHRGAHNRAVEDHPCVEDGRTCLEARVENRDLRDSQKARIRDLEFATRCLLWKVEEVQRHKEGWHLHNVEEEHSKMTELCGSSIPDNLHNAKLHSLYWADLC